MKRKQLRMIRDELRRRFFKPENVARRDIVTRFGMTGHPKTVDIACKVIEAEKLFAEFPSTTGEAFAFLRAYCRAKENARLTGRAIKPIPDGYSRKDVGL